jgi:hypothetical protein
MGTQMIPGELAAVTARMPLSVRHQPPEVVRPAEQLAVGDRIGVAARDAVPVGLTEEHAALKLAGHIAERDLGAARRFVNEVEHGLGPWDVSPWRLVEHLAEILVRRADAAGGHA